ncbi:UNVERIFIED_CONTAM: putative LRR receptor-like serine/threonine-protein kinase [Sesamum radiatum]|uniref:LRR receptor-like serine/threonine-protein kinase n=1 Tax=Sesamum radiatum TaxID=300843 RepID=A0AAW2QFN0_SESRA
MFFLCFSLSFTALEVECLSSDGQALLSLLSAADPYYKKSSPVLSSWNPSNPTPCSWQGITCSPQERVISLSIPDTFLNLSSLPSDLSSLSSLQLLNLSSTNISGSIPPSFGSLTQLRLLDLSSNSLSGPIPSELGKLTLLQFLFLNSNRLTGAIPQQLANLSSLQVLCLQDNLLNGSIPMQLGSLISLQQLRIGGNPYLTGEIPPQLGLLTNLTTFGAAATGLSGVIPPTFGNLINLQTLALYDTEVFGSIPSELGLCSELRNLYLHMNKLTGSIPPELGKLQKLTSMLCGAIRSPAQSRLNFPTVHPLLFLTCLLMICLVRFQSLEPYRLSLGTVLNFMRLTFHGTSSLDRSRRGIRLKETEQAVATREFLNRGIATQCSKMSVSCEVKAWRESTFSYLNKLILNNNLLTGAIPKSIRNLQKITLLDLSFNSFSGPIPPEIGYLTSLTISLDLKANRFIGEIPETMSGLTQLQSLDLSSNLLYGRISVLSVLTSLTFLNVSCNNFSGPIPVTPFFHTLTMNSFLENPHLCQSLDGSTCSSRLMRGNGLKSAKTIALVAVILISVTMAVVATWIIVARNHKYVIEKSGMPSSSTEEDFSYPWTFIPFQKLNFTIENILNCLRDENVIGKGCSGVVYKAEMPNGELVAVKKLWRTKKDEEPIDSFAAEIQILGHIRHRNIVKLLGYCSNKSVKLLLYNFIPNGNLQQLLQNNRNLDWETRYKIAVGSAQEYGYTVNITEKSDVYSYGVVLLEILSGRSAVEPQIGDGLHIVEWVKKKMGSFEPAVSVLDPKLQGLPDQLVQEMLQTLGIAMFCVNSSPAERPTMKEVVALLMEVKSPPEESGKTSQPLIKQSSNQS